MKTYIYLFVFLLSIKKFVDNFFNIVSVTGKLLLLKMFATLDDYEDICVYRQSKNVKLEPFSRIRQ